MRYLFVVLLLIALLYSCNRDTTDVVGSNAGPTYSAPASAPEKYRNKNEELGKADLSPEVGYSREKDAVPADPATPEIGDPAAAKRMRPERERPQVITQQRTRAATPAAPKTASATMSTPRQISVSAIAEPRLFRVSKTPCYGNCKQYALDLHEGGLLVLNGKRNVRHEGLHTQRMLGFQYGELIEKLNDLRAADLAEVYPENEKIPADLPATVLRFPDAEGEELTVRVYDLDAAPEPLAAFLQKVEEMAERGIWDRAVE